MNKRTDTKTLWKLFLSTLYISTFTFGGGFVIVTFMKQKFVDELHWLKEDEMLDFAALAQSSPGAIAVNAAILVGWRVGGFIGMVTSVIGTIIPPMAILSGISFFIRLLLLIYMFPCTERYAGRCCCGHSGRCFWLGR